MKSLPNTITAVAPLLRRGDLTPTDLVEACFARIDRYEPKVHAWVYLDRERALADARKLTAELQTGQDRGLLHGIPVGIKDIIDVFDMPTGCGSKLWANSYARKDATCVARLRQAGAIILGKTVTTPYAFLDPPPTRNPWNLERTPGGSSSGSAAAVACGMCYAALGTQTGGSVTRPASFCGVYSFKPRHGTVSVEGVLPLAPRLDHVGMMAKSIRDLAIIYQAISGPDSRIGFTFNGHSPILNSLQAIDQVDEVEQPELMILGGLFDERLHPEVRPHYERVVALFDRNLAAMLRVVPPADFNTVLKMQRVMMATEAAQVHQDRFRRHPEDYPFKIRELIEEGLSLPAVSYSMALTHSEEVEDLVTRMLGGLRYFVTPAAPSAASGVETTGDASFNAPWSFTGHATVSLPYGWTDDGLPLAIQVVGSPGCDDDLFQAAAWCERILDFQPRPLPL